MKELIVLIVALSLTSALLSLVFVSDKYKGNIRALCSLLIISVVLSHNYDFKFEKIELNNGISADATIDEVLFNAENIINKTIKDTLSEKFDLKFIDVKSYGSIVDDEYRLENIKIFINTEISAYDIMVFTEKEFDILGKVSVIKTNREFDDS